MNQARSPAEYIYWMELRRVPGECDAAFQYDAKIVYIEGEKNTAADALSRTEFVEDSRTAQERAHDLLGPDADEDGETIDAPVCLVTANRATIASVAKSLSSEACRSPPVTVATAGPRTQRLTASIDETFLQKIRDGYET
ncbi:hypothetical protein DFP72DRAFT_1153276 [Ephemerocybe angulata]|uniref:Uncharacterized protein n=1 Tax=Ephemerocybe angulata TaxID=980116 RepID=A0A8H6LXL7_9AGAR|nr:hypothetical protein DFP72DRAFT_1153276 [Tulosesus angulatus]